MPKNRGTRLQSVDEVFINPTLKSMIANLHRQTHSTSKLSHAVKAVYPDMLNHKILSSLSLQVKRIYLTKYLDLLFAKNPVKCINDSYPAKKVILTKFNSQTWEDISPLIVSELVRSEKIIFEPRFEFKTVVD